MNPLDRHQFRRALNLSSTALDQRAHQHQLAWGYGVRAGHGVYLPIDLLANVFVDQLVARGFSREAGVSIVHDHNEVWLRGITLAQWSATYQETGPCGTVTAEAGVTYIGIDRGKDGKYRVAVGSPEQVQQKLDESRPDDHHLDITMFSLLGTIDLMLDAVRDADLPYELVPPTSLTVPEWHPDPNEYAEWLSAVERIRAQAAERQARRAEAKGELQPA